MQLLYFCTKFRQKTILFLWLLFEKAKYYLLHYPRHLLLFFTTLLCYTLIVIYLTHTLTKEKFIETWGDLGGGEEREDSTICKLITVPYKEVNNPTATSLSKSSLSSPTMGNIVTRTSTTGSNSHSPALFTEPYPRFHSRSPFHAMRSANFFSTVINNNVVDNTFFFTVVHVKDMEYANLVKNWATSITLGTFTNALVYKRVIIADTVESCEILASIGVYNCYVDTCSSHMWLPIIRGGKSGILIYKYLWTEQALRRGYHVLYTDADAIFRKNSGDPLKYLVDDRLKYGGDGYTLPDVQMLSDHGPTNHECSKTDQKYLLHTLGRSSKYWFNTTYHRLYVETGKGVKHDKAITIEHSLPFLPCPLIDIWYEEGSTCVSSGFWYVRSTVPSLRLFQNIMNGIDASRDWEQKLLNNILPYYLMEQNNQEHTYDSKERLPLKFIVLDPRVIGNVNAQDCAWKDPDSSQINVPSSYTLPRLVSHMGYIVANEKLNAPKEYKVWYIDE